MKIPIADVVLGIEGFLLQDMYKFCLPPVALVSVTLIEALVLTIMLRSGFFVAFKASAAANLMSMTLGLLINYYVFTPLGRPSIALFLLMFVLTVFTEAAVLRFLYQQYMRNNRQPFLCSAVINMISYTCLVSPGTLKPATHGQFKTSHFSCVIDTMIPGQLSTSVLPVARSLSL
jgi:hypothetical protein